MIVALVSAAEVAFWVLPAAGRGAGARAVADRRQPVLAVSYTFFPKREPRAGAAGNPVDTEKDAGGSFRR
ncbi:hypothetical protein ACFVY4_27290 [Streptomyces sp. NPDC058299]|uniref:hypothetical protein n=1 Tax=Streptomyces sp. NPDC058299 TaxID=3346435 RepID=UPI0036EBAE9E